MLTRIKRIPGLVPIVLAVMVSAQAQQDAPLDTIRIDTNLVVLRVAVNEQQGRAVTQNRGK